MYFQPYGDEQQLNLNWIINEIINLHKQLDPDYETPSFTQVYPYSNLNRLNLDWVLSELKALKELAPTPVPTELDIQAVAEALVALPFDSNTSYQIYDFISRDGEIWRATEAIAAGGVWDETKWFKTKLGQDLAVLERWVNTINNSLTAEIQARQDADTALQNIINGLTSADISDDSDAGGANVKLSLNVLKGSLNAKLPHLESTGDNTDRLAEITALLATGGCVLGEGTFYISDTIVMPNNASLIGCGVGTVISLNHQASNKSAIKMAQYNTIENLKIVGNKTASATIGNVHGIEWSGDYSTSENEYTQPRVGKISNVYIDGFSGGGIYCYNTGYAAYTNINAVNVTISSCAVGIYIAYWSEYHKFTNIHTWNCYYGCINNGGNNSFVNCDFTGSKETGFLIDNTNDDMPNNTHGMCVGCLFNHIKNNTGLAVQIKNTHNGFVFDGCQFFYGNIEITNSTGLQFVNSNFGVVTITITGEGANLFADDMFSSQPTLNITNNIKSVFQNCYERINNTAISPFKKTGTLVAHSGSGVTLYEGVARQEGNIVTLSGWFYYTATQADIDGAQAVVACDISGVDMPTTPTPTNPYIRGVIPFGQYAYALTDQCYFVLRQNQLEFKPIKLGQQAYVINIMYMVD